MNETLSTRECILTFEALSAPSQVAALSHFLEARHAYIREFAVFDDELTKHFYVRSAFRMPLAAGAEALASLNADLAGVLAAFPQASGRIVDATERVRAVVMVSKTDHCLRELFTQIDSGELRLEIAAVVSNHEQFRQAVEQRGITFHHLPVTPATKAQQEAALMAIIEATQSEYLLLARYMQVLSDEFCHRMPERIVNIHHSFLPGFKGARPYQQAWDRGVKLIGATAHFANPELDEGPIIEQELQRVDHTFTASALLNVGRNIECLAFGRAVRWLVDRRVFINGLRTVVLK